MTISNLTPEHKLTIMQLAETAKNMNYAEKILLYDSKKRNAGLDAILSLLIPGLGQMFQGRIARGLVILILTVIFCITIIGVIIGFIIWLWNIYDAYKYAKDYNTDMYTALFTL